MEKIKTTYTTIDEYISQAEPEVQETLKTLRNLIKELVPEAKEKMSWQMPTFDYHGNLVHFAIHKNHIGFYPGASGISNFHHELSEYKSSKGAVQFPIKQPLPYELIRKIVEFRAAENLAAAKEKRR